MLLTPLLVWSISGACVAAADSTIWSPVHREKFVPNSYQVILKDGTSHAVAAEHHEWLTQLTTSDDLSRKTELRKRTRGQATLADLGDFKGVTHVWDLGDEFRGYYIHTTDYVVDQIRSHPAVEIIEPEPYYYASPVAMNGPIMQLNEPWGLGRISHQGPENISWPYLYSAPGQGEGVDIYILDTGILAEHEEFKGRVAAGHSVFDDEKTVVDFNGHGTHCAGTAAGTTFGVAKKATIVPVKVLSQNGAAGGTFLTKGMQWARGMHLDKVKNGTVGFRGSVLSMSLGSAKDTVVNRWATVLAKDGIHLVAAAGNEKMDACTKSPASSPNVTTVGAMDRNDEFAGVFSNFGSCVDVHAPGVDITSASHTDKTGNATFSGSSMACPHVAGVLATLLSRQAGDNEAMTLTRITPGQLKADLLRIATKGVIRREGLPANTTDAIVYSGGSKTNYSEILKRGGWPECCT